MRIEWRYWAGRGWSREQWRWIEKMQEALPELLERLKAEFGGSIPEKMVCVFVNGPVEVKIRKMKNVYTQDTTVGLTTEHVGRTWIFVSVMDSAGRTLIHEAMHAIGHICESYVDQAVKGFVNKVRLENGSEVQGR